MRPFGAALLLACSPGLAWAQGPVIARSAELALADGPAPLWVFGTEATPLEVVAQAVQDAGGTVRFHSRWLHAVSADLSAAALQVLQHDRRLRRLQAVARYPSAPPPRPPEAVFGTSADDSTYGPSVTGLRRMNLLPLMRRGARGLGVRIAILDTGFETELPAFANATIGAATDFLHGDTVVANEPIDSPGQSAHGTLVWSLLAADVPGTIVGIARGATYLLAKVEDVASETRLDEDRWTAAVEWADANGADIISSSINYLTFDDGFSYGPQDLNGDIAVTTVVADSAVARGIAVVAAAGNLGSAYRTLMTPADGDSVITVGAEDSLGALAAFSSRGPTADGRLKPDLVGPGVAVLALGPSGDPERVAGTSFATPYVAGGIALMREFQPGLTPVEIRASLRATGSNRARPDSARGWGRPDVAAATYFPMGVTATAGGDSVFASITPNFSITAPMAAAVAAPFTRHLRIARDPSFTDLLLDTTTAAASVSLSEALQPGDSVYVEAGMTAEDSVHFTALPTGPFVAPAWATLTTFNEPAGSIAQVRRPTFEWTSPQVSEPPGPFVYDVEVFRNDDQTVAARGRGLIAREFVPPEDLERNTPYRWRVTAFVGADSVTVESAGTFVITDQSLPVVTLLFQNFPNPFPNRGLGRNATCVWFDLARTGDVRLDVLDVRGLVVHTIVPGPGIDGRLAPGRYGRPDGASGSCDPRFEWDGRATNGRMAPRGLYLLRLVTPDGTFFKRMLFMGEEFE